MFLRLQLKSPNVDDTYKTRRPHRKSRYGCSQCKGRRIKCNELSPQCGRCRKMKLDCIYPTHPERSSTNSGNSVRTARSPVSKHSDHSSVVSGSYGNGRPRSLSHSSSKIDLPLRSEVSQMLAPADLGLLKHYLEHTSRVLTIDADDQYALQICIPNLAIQSKPLMQSVLALAAVCRCSDIINQTRNHHSNIDARGQVVELLSLANQYHMESLREIQATLPEAKQYNYVLANAAMMGMYGSANHSTRIWLARTATFADHRLGDSVPKLPQWISLFRAVQLAYVGMLDNRIGTDADHLVHSPARSAVSPLMTAAGSMQHECNNVSSRGCTTPDTTLPKGPATSHPLYRIISATILSATAKLHVKAREITAFYDPNPVIAPQPNPADLQACYLALAIFDGIVADTFQGGNSFAPDVEIEPMGQQLSEVSPWLQRYTARTTSMVPSRQPQRMIMAFIHKVPTRYLALVDDMLVTLQQTELPLGMDDVWGIPTAQHASSMSTTLEPSMAHRLALEIFAHWLVLVILLENVWWIGGIGAWELGRCVAARSEARWRGCLWNKEEDWWPESMYHISRQFNKHRT